MFSYEFVRIAFVCAILISILLPAIGAPLVQKRLSNIGDALSHTSLAGVAIGVVCGFSEIGGAIVISVVASLIIELIRRKFHKYSELSIVIVMSFAVALVSILSQNIGAKSLSSYLFGNINTVKISELIVLAIFFVITLIFYLGFYHQIFYTSYNELQASLDGVHVKTLTIFQTVLTAVIIAVASKVVGALMVASLMVIPYAASLQLSKSYKGSLIISIIIALISSISGTIIAYYSNSPTGGTMVMISIIILIICNYSSGYA